MPAPEPTRRFTLALTAAVAATTVAVGVTAATLLGWFRPVAPAPTSPAGTSVVYVPIVPSAPPDLPAVEPATQTRVAMDEPRVDAEREREHEHEREDDDE